jgi:transglutaminase-like putative cysteine protease
MLERFRQWRLEQAKDRLDELSDYIHKFSWAFSRKEKRRYYKKLRKGIEKVYDLGGNPYNYVRSKHWEQVEDIYPDLKMHDERGEEQCEPSL